MVPLYCVFDAKTLLRVGFQLKPDFRRSDVHPNLPSDAVLTLSFATLAALLVRADAIRTEWAIDDELASARFFERFEAFYEDWKERVVVVGYCDLEMGRRYLDLFEQSLALPHVSAEMIWVIAYAESLAASRNRVVLLSDDAEHYEVLRTSLTRKGRHATLDGVEIWRPGTA